MCVYRHDVTVGWAWLIDLFRPPYYSLQVPLIVYENGGMSFDRRKEILEYFLNLGYYYACAGKQEVYNAYTDKVIDCWDLILYHAEFVLRDDAGLVEKKKHPNFVLMEGL